MSQPSVELTRQPPPRPAAGPQPWYILTGSAKMMLIVLIGGLLYMRLWVRKRSHDHLCPHCGHRNPPHRANCSRCSAPLFSLKS